MGAFQGILLMLLAAVVLLGISRRIRAPYPAVLAVAGAALAVTPIRMPFRLDPNLALALFVAPVLLDAAYDTSVRDLKENWRPIIRLVLIAVLITTAAVAWVSHALVPGLPWAAAIALGAIVAPPDAAAANTVLQSVKPPHHISVILGGESLLNDATALIVYRLAVAAAMAATPVTFGTVAPAFALAVFGSFVAGPLLALVWMQIIERLKYPPSAIILQFVGTFGVWIVAEEANLSPILTVVAYAVTIAHFSPARTPARMRVPSYAVWETAVVVLNALAFVIIGLELAQIIADAKPGDLARWTRFSAIILATVIVVRLGWAMTYNTSLRLQHAWRRDTHMPQGIERPSWQAGVIIGWCGMRGLVTVATALALPGNFPERDLLLFTAFVVTLGTLVIQGATLRPLVRLLGVHDGGFVDREVRTARVALAEAGLAMIDGDTSDEARALRGELQIEHRTADEAEDGDGRPVLPSKVLRGRVLKRRRERLLELRNDGTIGDDAFHLIEEELDFADLAVGQRI